MLHLGYTFSNILDLSVLMWAGDDTGDHLVYGTLLDQGAASCAISLLLPVASVYQHNKPNLQSADELVVHMCFLSVNT